MPGADGWHATKTTSMLLHVILPGAFRSQLDSGTFYLVAPASSGAEAKLQLMDGARVSASHSVDQCTKMYLGMLLHEHEPVISSAYQ